VLLEFYLVCFCSSYFCLEFFLCVESTLFHSYLLHVIKSFNVGKFVYRVRDISLGYYRCFFVKE
jgi:hypothetical protein